MERKTFVKARRLVISTAAVAGLFISCRSVVSPLSSDNKVIPTVASRDIVPENADHQLEQVNSGPTNEAVESITASLQDSAVCLAEDARNSGEVFVGESIGVKRRQLPQMQSTFKGASAQNTKLAVECEREIDGETWLQVRDSKGPFWVPQGFTSPKPVVIVPDTRPSVGAVESIQPPVQPAPVEDPLKLLPFNWTRNEVLFGPQAGFEKARNGQSLTVWVDPTISNLNVGEIIGPWNKLAGWNLFVSGSGSGADIVFTPSDSTWVRPSPDYSGPFSSCTINWNISQRDPIWTAWHETGHCLGFVDFTFGNINPAGFVNAQRCDNVSKLYFGIMALGYCNGEDYAFRAHDRKLLELAGYAR